MQKVCKLFLFSVKTRLYIYTFWGTVENGHLIDRYVTDNVKLIDKNVWSDLTLKGEKNNAYTSIRNINTHFFDIISR